jgi:CheY-like chemotaxis protein
LVRDFSPSAGTILVIDDERELRLLAEAMLEDLGYSALLAENGEAAVRMLQQNATAVTAVVLDLTMPGMGPEETLRRLKEVCPAVPVIILSGHGEDEVRRRFDVASVAGSIQKPYTETDLEAALTKALERVSDAPPILNLQRLTDDDFAELSQEFLTARKLELPRMADLLGAGDFEGLELMGHSLKGSGGCFGHSELTRLGSAIEHYAQVFDGVACGEQLALLKDCLASLTPDPAES